MFASLFVCLFALSRIFSTRPKPVKHGYVFSMSVGTLGEWLKLDPFFVGGGGGWQFFKNKYIGRQTP